MTHGSADIPSMYRLAALAVAAATCLSLIPSVTVHGSEPAQLTLSAGTDRVELTSHRQKLTFERVNGLLVLSTAVWKGHEWSTLFDAGRPVVDGPLFGLQPTGYVVAADTSDRKVVEFGGRHVRPDYDWTMRVEAAADNPLFRFTITCQLPRPQTLDAPQPVVALWMRRPAPSLHLDQGPESIYGNLGVPHGFGFPAAFLWDAGREAAIFFNMTPMHWMQADGVWRFHDVRIMTVADHGAAGLGLHFKKLSGRRLPAGAMVVEFYLYQGVRAGRPTGLEALDTMLRVFAPLHPNASVLPHNYLTDGPLTWDNFAHRTLADLMASNETCRELETPWRDEPLGLVAPQSKMIVHPGRASADWSEAGNAWDFSTVNNHLTPWILLARLGGQAEALRMGKLKTDALPRFYDPRARLLRHGTRQPPHVGDLEMTWQNLFFHLETMRAASALPAADFNPAVAGRFLMATAGLRELARHVDYVFPQWFDPYRKQPVVQNDAKTLGIVREPWQVGCYAYLMLQAFEMTDDPDFFDEAKRSIESLMEHMRFRVSNAVYDRTYTDPSNFPVTELFGNAYGIAAAYRLYEQTGDQKFLRYSRDFLNTLLRLTFWYEDETDAVSRELRNAGLFYPHCGAHVATPWETAEAYLMIAWTLKHDCDHPLTDLLVRLCNLNRVNAFYFFPAAWSPVVRTLDAPRQSKVGQYFPIEPFYCLEGNGGHRGATAAYMASLSLWNAWLYEALAEATNRQCMVLNLDSVECYEEALTGLQRHLLVYNPGPAASDCRVVLKHLPDGNYHVVAGSQESDLNAVELGRGVPVALRAGEYLRLTVRASDGQHRQQQLTLQQDARDCLARAYRTLQEHAIAYGVSAVAPENVRAFVEARGAYTAGRYEDAHDAALRLVEGPR